MTTTPNEAQDLESLRTSIEALRARRRRLTITISKLLESKRTIEARLRKRAQRQEKNHDSN